MAVAIKIRYFASLKEKLGRESDNLDWVASLNVADVWAKSVTEVMPDNTLVAVNMEYVSLEYIISDGDEVAFFPPVTGG